MADFNKTVDLDKGLNQILDKIDRKAEELHRRGQEAGEAIGRGIDDGIDVTVEKIKISSIKTDKAFKNLSDKIKKQVQQLSANINGKDTKVKIDFSDIDINSDDIKKQIERKVKSIKASDLIDFDTKNFDSQLTNFVTLFMKYKGKLDSLKQAYPNISVPKDAQNNLQQQLVLATELHKMFGLLNKHGALFTSIDPRMIQKELSKIQQFSGGDVSKSVGGYEELSKVLKEIQGSLKIISDTFANENNSMKAMAENGKTSFESLSQAIIEVYNNLTQVQSLVDTISKKDFNITHITQTGGGGSNLQTLTQQMAVARETMEHLRSLYDQAGDTLQGLAKKGQIDTVFEYQKQLQELDLTAIGKSVKGANSEMKLASILAEMQDYIDKLTQINELRNKFDLGEWKDTFVSTQKPIVKPVMQPKSQITETPIVAQPQNTVATTNTEAQQMWQLKAAIDEVSNAIGRKNAGFVKEKEIVDASVNAEEAKLRELVGVITNEIGNALDNIKTKFAQSFVVPELDKNNLQTSFDEIYNKFVELKDKISTMKVDVGVNSANITQAIQEALYAKEIAANYKEVGFEDIFESQFDYGTWQNRFTGEIFDTFDAVDKEFDEAFKGLFKSKDGYFLGTKEEMFADFLSRQSANIAPEQNDWAQVIVEAINTQGGRIVESIKLLLPKNISENVDAIDEKELTNAFQVLVRAIESFGQQTGKKPDAFFRSIEANNSYAKSIRTPEVDNALRTLGLLSNSGEITFTIPDTGARNIGVAIGEKLVASGQEKENISNAPELMKKLNEAAALGASVPRIISLIEKNNMPLGYNGLGDAIFQLQTRSPGVNIASPQANNDFSGVTNEQIDRLIHTFEVISKVGLYPDFIGDNILLDKQKGFSLIDLDTENIHARPMDDAQDMVQAFLKNVFREANLSSSEFQTFSDRVNQRLKLPAEQRLVNADTIVAEQMVASQTKTETKPSEAKITPTMDDGAVAKVVADNVAKTPATVKVTPVIDGEIIANQPKEDLSSLVNQYVDLIKNNINGNEPLAPKIEDFINTNPLIKDVEDQMHIFHRLSTVDQVARDKLTASDLMQRIQGKIPGISVADSASNTEQAINGESQSAIDAAKTFVDAANAKKQFVEANKQVAETATTSEDAVKKEAEAAKTVATTVGKVAKDLAKTKDVFNDAGELIQTDTTKRFKTDKAIVTETDSTKIMRDDDGNETTSTITTIVNDFEKLSKETKKSEEAVARAQKKLDEFLARFQSKSGGNAKFISGFSDLEGMTVTSDNMEDVFNKMMALQGEYSKLETNFRKGQSSLNPFVNAITKSENIGNIFGDVERQFNGLTSKSDELVDKFNKLQDLSKKIQEFTQLMNSSPDAISPDMFSEFSKQVGEFNVLKSQVEGSIKAEGRIEAEDTKKQAEAYAEILRLVKERNKFLATATSSEDGSIKQRNALTDALRVEQQLHNLGKQIVLTDEQRAELARIREEQARKIRDIEADNKVKSDNQKASTREQKRKKEVDDYLKLVQQRNEYEAKATKGGSMQSTYEAKVAELQKIIIANDKQSIMNQEEKNKLLAIEEAHQLKIAEIKQKDVDKQFFKTQNDKLQGKFDAGYLSEASFSNWQNELAMYQSYLDGTVVADEATIQKKKTSLTQLYDHLNKISNASRTFFASGGEILPTFFNTKEIQDAGNSLRDLYKVIVTERFDGMKTSVTNVNETLGRLTFTVDNGEGALAQYTIAMDRASGATKLMSGNTKETLTTVQQFGKALKTDVRGMFSAFIGGMSGMYAVGRYFKEGIQYVRELDKALTELKKVTDETEETYDRFLETAGKTSTRIGSTLSNMTSATAEFAKLGYDIEQASSMAESALVYTNVGDNVDVETGSQSIISTLKAFGIEANNTMSIVDKFNEVGNNFAITTKGIGDALQVSASAMAAAGNTLDETIALTTAANTIVQNPNTVGKMLCRH